MILFSPLINNQLVCKNFNPATILESSHRSGFWRYDHSSRAHQTGRPAGDLFIDQMDTPTQ